MLFHEDDGSKKWVRILEAHALERRRSKKSHLQRCRHRGASGIKVILEAKCDRVGVLYRVPSESIHRRCCGGHLNERRNSHPGSPDSHSNVIICYLVATRLSVLALDAIAPSNCAHPCLPAEDPTRRAAIAMASHGIPRISCRLQSGCCHSYRFTFRKWHRDLD